MSGAGKSIIDLSEKKCDNKTENRPPARGGENKMKRIEPFADHPENPPLSVAYRYVLGYLAVVLAASALIAGVVFSLTARELRNQAITTQKSAMELAANDLQTQYELLETVHYKIRMNTAYMPFYHASGYHDPELLEHFATFASYSPLCSQYFMFYRDAQLIYTSEKTTSRFPIYVKHAMKLTDEQTAALYDRLNTLTEPVLLSPDDNTLLIAFPLAFTQRTSSVGGTVVFLIPKAQLLARMQKVSGAELDPCAVSFNGEELVNHGMPEYHAVEISGSARAADEKQTGAHIVAARSEDGQFTVYGVAANALVRQSLRRHRTTLLLSCAGVVAVLAGLAVLMGYRNVKPLRRLAQMCRSDDPDAPPQNELEQIERTLRGMETRNRSSLRCIREQLLRSALSGNDTQNLTERWAAFDIRFPHPYFSVFLIDTQGMDPAQRTQLTDQVSDRSDEDVRLYGVEMPEEQVVAVLANLRYPELHGEVTEYLCALGGSDGAEPHVYSGKDYPTAYKFAISYQEARAVCRITRRSMAVPQGETAFVADSQALIGGLLEAVRTRNEPQFDRMAQRLHDYVNSDAPSMLFQKYICYDIISQATRAATELGVEIDQRQISSLLLLTDFGQFLIDLKVALAPVFAHAPAEPRPRDDYMREDIRRFVENNIANCDFSLDTLASEFHLSANYMGAMVKKLFGQSYKDYVTAARMQKAKELLLRCPNMTVNEISLRVGYRKASNFIQKFKDFTGATPLHFREQRGEEE